MFRKRILPGALIAVISLLFILLAPITRLLFMTALAFASVYELNAIAKTKKISYMWSVPLAYIAGQFLLSYTGMDYVWMLSWFLLMVFAGFFKAILHPQIGFRSMLFSQFSLLWPFVFFGLMMALSMKEYALYVICFGYFGTWISDSGAFFAGKYLGKHKLAPLVSPNKTWEGVAGGVLGSVLSAGIIYLVLHTFFVCPPFYICLLANGIGSLFGQAGDLTASFIKRGFGVKDYSSLIGEHGGILDKMDGILFSVPVCWLVFYVFGCLV